MSSDAHLLDAWAAGDAEAADALFSRHLQDLVRFFRSKTADDVEDCVHETLVRVMERRGKLAPDSSFRAYMFAVARNLLYERLRKRNRLGDPTTTSLQDLGDSPSAIAAARQEQQLLLEGLRRVPLETQILLELFYWEDLTLAELGEVFAIPTGTVKSRLHRGRRELRDAIEIVGKDSTALLSTLTRLEDWGEIDPRGGAVSHQKNVSISDVSHMRMSVECCACILLVVAACTSRVDHAGEASSGGAESSESTGTEGDSTAVVSSTESTGSTQGETTTAECVVDVSAGGFTLWTDSSLGWWIEVFDMNADSTPDLVGRSGVVGISSDEGFDVTTLSAAGTDPVVPGLFGGAADGDLVVAAGTQLQVYLDGSGNDPVITMAPETDLFDAGDFDGDGLFDLALRPDGGTRVEIWHGSASGEFIVGASVPTEGSSDVEFMRIDPSRLDVVVVYLDRIEVFRNDGADELEGPEVVQSVENLLVRAVPARGTGAADELVGAAVYTPTLQEPVNAIRFIFREAGEWTEVQHAVDGEQITPPASGDLDGDGLHDIIVATSSDAGTMIEVFCRNSQLDLVGCGTVVLAHSEIDAVAVLPGPDGARLVYATKHEGAWIADTTATSSCP